MIRIRLSGMLGEKRTQADLARATGIRPSTISDYYNEVTDRINLEHDLTCEALDCDLDELLVREPSPIRRVHSRSNQEKTR